MKNASDVPSGPDSPGEGDTGIPCWIKRIIYLHIGMTYGLVVLTGTDNVPFSLGDIPLAALILSGLGSFTGPVLKRILTMLGSEIKPGS